MADVETLETTPIKKFNNKFMIFSRLGVYAAIAGVIWISISPNRNNFYLFSESDLMGAYSLLSTFFFHRLSSFRRGVERCRRNSAASLLNAITILWTMSPTQSIACHALSQPSMRICTRTLVDFICLLINLTNPQWDDQIKWITRVHDAMMNARR